MILYIFPCIKETRKRFHTTSAYTVISEKVASMALTIKDISKEAGVSVSTVSRAMNGTGYVSLETKDKIQSLVKQLDYVPSAMAKGLSKDINNIVGALIPEIDNPFFSGTLQGINHVCDERGLNLMLCGTENIKRKELNFLYSLREQRVQGLLVASAATAQNMDQEYIAFYREMNIPTVLFDRNIPGSNCDCVLFDDTQAVMELTNPPIPPARLSETRPLPRQCLCRLCL